MKYLITGGAGFIGSNLAEKLAISGHEVVVLDNLSTGKRENLENAEKLGVKLVVGSAADKNLVGSLLPGVGAVFHLAASVGVERIMDELTESIENTVRATETILELSAAYGVRVLITSTSEVYGRSTDKSFSEDDDLRMGPTLKTRWSYACAKALDEYLAFAYWREKDLPVTVVRLFNTVGAKQSSQYGMVLPRFVEQALTGKDLTVYGTGQQSRCFCDVSDVVLALENLIQEGAAVGQVFNVGGSEEIKIEDLAKRVIELTSSKSGLKYISYGEAYADGFDDIDRRVPDVSKIERVIGWRQNKSLDEIILSVVHEKKEGALV